MNELQDKVAIITGAASGIGRAAALRYAEQGAKLILGDLDEAGGAALASELAARGNDALFVRADVARAEDCEALVAAALTRHGRLDAAFNNAGLSDGPLPPGTLDYPLALWDRMIAVNLTGVFHCLRAQVRAMLDGGGGAIVNTASIAGQIAFPGVPGYVAAKHGVVGLTKVIALEYGTRGIRCNAIAPGVIDTPMTSAVLGDAQAGAMLTAMIPAGRAGAADDVAALAVFLASDRARYINGAVLPVDGGYLAR